MAESGEKASFWGKLMCCRACCASSPRVRAAQGKQRRWCRRVPGCSALGAVHGMALPSRLPTAPLSRAGGVGGGGGAESKTGVRVASLPVKPVQGRGFAVSRRAAPSRTWPGHVGGGKGRRRKKASQRGRYASVSPRHVMLAVLTNSPSHAQQQSRRQGRPRRDTTARFDCPAECCRVKLHVESVCL